MMFPYGALIQVILIWLYVLICTVSPLRASGINEVLHTLGGVSVLGFYICMYQMGTLKKIEEIKAKLEMDKK